MCNPDLAWHEHDLDVAYDMWQRGIDNIDEYYAILQQENSDNCPPASSD